MDRFPNFISQITDCFLHCRRKIFLGEVFTRFGILYDHYQFFYPDSILQCKFPIEFSRLQALTFSIRNTNHNRHIYWEPTPNQAHA